MLLAIDVGNTNVVFALFEGRSIKARWRIATDPRRTGDEYAVWLMQLLQIEGLDRSAIKKIIVSTVVPRALHNLEVLADKYFGVKALVAGVAPVDYGMEIDVDEPRSILALRRPLTRSTLTAPTRAGSSPPGSTSRSMRWLATRPSCRASRSAAPIATA